MTRSTPDALSSDRRALGLSLPRRIRGRCGGSAVRTTRRHNAGSGERSACQRFQQRRIRGESRCQPHGAQDQGALPPYLSLDTRLPVDKPVDKCTCPQRIRVAVTQAHREPRAGSGGPQRRVMEAPAQDQGSKLPSWPHQALIRVTSVFRFSPRFYLSLVGRAASSVDSCAAHEKTRLARPGRSRSTSKPSPESA